MSAIISRKYVSIHTPTQGVTDLWEESLNILEVSIHTPTQGVTVVDVVVCINGQFQSTHPRRV